MDETRLSLLFRAQTGEENAWKDLTDLYRPLIWEGRRHFFFAAARAMREILVEQARRKAGPKHGGGGRRQELDDACAVLEPPSEDVLAVHEALAELEASDPLEAQIVLLRYFTGLTMDETAAVLGVPPRTLDRQWRYIRAWLMKRLS
jgi:RNA polymerase sigma factor (TIGR02999 family)